MNPVWYFLIAAAGPWPFVTIYFLCFLCYLICPNHKGSILAGGLFTILIVCTLNNEFFSYLVITFILLLSILNAN
jgi:hypothetical protein